MPNRFNPAVFILVRFAMVAPFSDAFNDRTRAKQWLEKRIPVFHRVCLPGLERQTRQPDAIFFGLVDGLDAEAMAIKSAASSSLPLEVAFQSSTVDKSQSIMAAFRSKMSEYVTGDHTHIITIRLDNDDAVHQDYVKEVVLHFEREFSQKPSETDYYASYVLGMQANGEDFFTYIYPNGPFQARMEWIKSSSGVQAIKGVYAINHTKIFGEKNASLIVKQTPYWIQYIHGTNVANCIKGGSMKLAELDTILQDFGLGHDAFLE